MEIAWRALQKHAQVEDHQDSPETGIAKETVERVIEHLMTYPDDLNPITKVNRLIKGKKKLYKDKKLDWAMGELLAYASILLEGQNVRMSGQDVQRGTFSHRHAILFDNGTDREYNRINDLQEEQGKFMIYNSLLSEFAVLGFEYGYSLASPDTLVLWEAQFGDFYNGAQTIVDQYISAAESKWQRMSGLVMLLPHGYEGQGPRTLQCSCRTVFTIVCRVQYDDCQLHDTCQFLPPDSPTIGAPISQTISRDVAQISIASSRGDFGCGRFCRRHSFSRNN